MNFYCERTTEQILDEPINAISNIFFIIVSLSLIKILRKNQSNKIYYIQPILIFFIGSLKINIWDAIINSYHF